MWRPILAAAVIAGGTVPDAQIPSRDYTQWRGQQRDGAASGFVAPVSWPEALRRRWTVAVGEGYATPLVSGDSVYVFSRRDGNEVMTSLNAATGAERWQSSYAAPYTPSQPTAAHGAGSKATPVLQDGRLFTLGISGIVTAFEAATGRRLWQTPAPAEPPFFSAASSPLAEGSMVIVHPGDYGPLTAFDSGTGAVKWTAGSRGFFSSPIAVTLHGTRQVVAATEDSVIGVTLDGRVLWRYPWKGGNGSTTPVIAGETIVVGSPDGVRAIRPSIRDGTWLAETAWETADVTLYLSNPVVVSGALFGLSTRNRGQFFALDAQTGRVLWLGEPRAATNTALVKAGNLLLLLNDDAELIVAAASRRGFESVARYTVAGSATWAQPAVSGDRILVKDVDSVSLWTID
jgi:outer membrane protein assembly factor BamB